MIKKVVLTLPVFMLYIFLMPLAANASRSITVQLKASEHVAAADAGSVQLYSFSYALVIGNDAYRNGWPPLSGAVQDADMIALALKAHGFDVTLKKNLTSSQLKTAFEEFFILKGENPKARLFVWFAGHGHTLRGEGYLVPVDAPNPNTNEAMFKLKALSLRNFGTYVRSANAKHAFSVFDSCFSGTVFESQRALPPAAITLATTKPVRQFLTSGDANQKVSDNGSFRKIFIRAVNGASRADANGDGYLTASELGLYMTDKITNLTHARQTPKYGKLNDLKYDQGDFVFQLPNGSQAAIHAPHSAAPLGANNASMELEFWDTIKISKDPAMYKAYLKKFPDGTFADLARLKAGIPMGGRPQPLFTPEYALTILSDPSDARVKILNIGPRYQAGMLLKPGRYHVEVSRKGYDTKREWVKLGSNNLVHQVHLAVYRISPRPNIPLKVSKDVWHVLESSKSYQHYPRSPNIKVSYQTRSQIQYTGSKSSSLPTPKPSKTTFDIEITPMSDKCSRVKTQVTMYLPKTTTSSSTSYSCSGINLGSLSKKGKVIGVIKSIDALKGSLFPMKVGAQRTIRFHNSYVKDHRFDSSFTNVCKVVSKGLARNLNPKLKGTAWKIKCQNSYRSNYDNKLNEGESIDYYLEDLAVRLSQIGVLDFSEKKVVLPYPSYQNVIIAEGEYGSRTTTSYQNYTWSVNKSNKLRTTGGFTKAQFGVKISEVDKKTLRVPSLKNKSGALVVQVINDSATDKVGIKTDGVITYMDAEKINTVRDLYPS